MLWSWLLLPLTSLAGIPEGINWLATQQNPDGSFGNTAAALATEVQSTAEVLRAYQALGQQTQPAFTAALGYLNADPETNTEYLARNDLGPPARWSSLRVAYHSACSLQHGQQVTSEPKMLLKKAGFSVLDVAESHICCGSAGTYNILQPELAGELKARKAANLQKTKADLVAAGNIGCITHLASGMEMPIVHTVELLDWAYGGPVPRGLDRLKGFVTDVPGPSRTADDYIAA